MSTKVRVVSLRSFEPVIAGLSPKTFRVWQRALDWSCFHALDGILTPTDIESIGAKPAQIKELVSKGVWKRDEAGRTFVAELREGPVVAEVEGSEVSHGPMTPAERARRYRERKSNTPSRKSVTERDEFRDGERDDRHENSDAKRDVAVTLVPQSPPILSGSESFPEIPEGSSTLTSSSDLTGSARVRRNRRRSTLPKDWKPTEEHVKRALETGLDLGREEMRFRSHHEAKGSLFANWNAAFTTWLINAQEWAKPHGLLAHEKTRQEEARRPYHEPFKAPEPSGPKASPSEALEAIAGYAQGIGRRISG